MNPGQLVTIHGDIIWTVREWLDTGRVRIESPSGVYYHAWPHELTPHEATNEP